MGSERFARALYNRGESLRRLGRRDEAIVVLHRAQAANGGAACLERVGQQDDAIALDDQVVKRFSEHEQPGIAEAVAYARARLRALGQD